MSAKRIFILNGHPAERSLSRSLAEAYGAAAQEAGHQVRLTHLRDMRFDPDYGFAGYAEHKPLEPDLEQLQGDIDWAEHMVLTTPMWWGGVPAQLKGLFDRAFLPGWAFDPRRKKRGLPMPLLTGRSARALVTSDTPLWYLRLAYHKAMLRQLKGQIFGFIGMKPTRISYFAQAGKAGADKVNPWLDQVRALGRQGA